MAQAVVARAAVWSVLVSLAAAGNVRFHVENALWTYRTPPHFSVYGAVTGKPILPEEIRGTALQQDRVVFAVVPPGHSRLRLICLNRLDGKELWHRIIPGEDIPITRDFPVIGDRMFLALYKSRTRQVTILTIAISNGDVLWSRDAGVALSRYQYGDLLDVDPGIGSIDLYLPETMRNNRIRFAIDGSRIDRFSYNGYFWPAGARRSEGLLFGFDGEPLSMSATSLLALDEHSGVVKWRLATTGHWTSPPVVAGNMLMITTRAKLQAVDIATGHLRWTVPLDGDVPPHPAPPVVVADHVLVGQHFHAKNPLHRNVIFTRHVIADGVKNGVLPLGERPIGLNFVRGVGSLVFSEAGAWIDVFAPSAMSLHGSLAFGPTFSRFAFTTPRALLGSGDVRGFLVVTSDGKLRYFETLLSQTRTSDR